jgi:hypothetical protein
MTPIVVYHAAAMGNWHEVVREQMSLLRECGLAQALGDAGDAVRLSHVGHHLETVLGEAEAQNVPVKVIRSDPNVSHYETFAMIEIDRLAKEEKAVRPILYFHTKGVSSPGDHYKKLWRKVMEYHVVSKWQENAKAIKDYDAVGFGWWDCGGPHFPGTFWMVSPDWVRKLPDFVGYHWQVHNGRRYSCEGWIGSIPRPRILSHGIRGTKPLWELNLEEYLPVVPKEQKACKVAVCSLGCSRRSSEIHSWNHLTELQGNYSLYLNYETDGTDSPEELFKTVKHRPDLDVSFDVWSWRTVGKQWRKLPQFDQDQARLAPIICARSMCIEYAMQADATHLLFVDADIIPPLDIIPKLLEADKLTVGALVHGRGIHSNLTYVFGEKRRFWNGSHELIECEHSNTGFCLIARRVFEQIRFRYGTTEYPDGRCVFISECPAFHFDVLKKFGEPHYVRADVVGKHVGDLKEGETAQYS